MLAIILIIVTLVLKTILLPTLNIHKIQLNSVKFALFAIIFTNYYNCVHLLVVYRVSHLMQF